MGGTGTWGFPGEARGPQVVGLRFPNPDEKELPTQNPPSANMSSGNEGAEVSSVPDDGHGEKASALQKDGTE